MHACVLAFVHALYTCTRARAVTNHTQFNKHDIRTVQTKYKRFTNIKLSCSHTHTNNVFIQTLSSFFLKKCMTCKRTHARDCDPSQYLLQKATKSPAMKTMPQNASGGGLKFGVPSGWAGSPADTPTKTSDHKDAGGDGWGQSSTPVSEDGREGKKDRKDKEGKSKKSHKDKDKKKKDKKSKD